MTASVQIKIHDSIKKTNGSQAGLVVLKPKKCMHMRTCVYRSTYTNMSLYPHMNGDQFLEEMYVYVRICMCMCIYIYIHSCIQATKCNFEKDEIESAMSFQKHI